MQYECGEDRFFACARVGGVGNNSRVAGLVGHSHSITRVDPQLEASNRDGKVEAYAGALEGAYFGEIMTKKQTTNGKIALVVTTAHRGVFFGYGQPTTKKTIRLTNARMCVYWSADVKGVLGLAHPGPSRNCKIGPAVPAITLQGITAVLEVSEEAEGRWQKEPWV